MGYSKMLLPILNSSLMINHSICLEQIGRAEIEELYQFLIVNH